MFKGTNLNCSVQGLLKELEDFPEYMRTYKDIVTEFFGTTTSMVEDKWIAILKLAEAQ